MFVGALKSSSSSKYGLIFIMWENYIIEGYYIILGFVMAVVAVDERGRLTLPKEIGVRKTRAVVIPAGSFIVIVPLPPKPSEYAGSWLDTRKRRSTLKKTAEKAARKDAVKRARRRKQL